MRQFIIAILVFVTLLACVLLYVGDDAHLILTSTADRGFLQFEPLEVSWQFAITFISLSIIGILAVWTFLGWLWRLPSRWKSGAGIRRRSQALDAVEEALLAASEGDMSRARRKSEKARQLIESPALGQIVSAMAAQSGGDYEAAIEHYQSLLKDEKTQAVGRRGLAQQYLAVGNLSGAREHAGEAYQTDKNARWAFDVLFQAQIQDYMWAEASDTLDRALARKHIDRDIGRRRRAVVETAQADYLENNQQLDAALPHAETALQLAPDFAPAAALTARLLAKTGEVKKAASTIEKAWSHYPHPALALAYRDLWTSETDKVRHKRMLGLVKANSDHRESIILKAEADLEIGDAVAAWSGLSPLLQAQEPSARLCLLAARAEKMLNNPADAALWTEKAATAHTEPDWSDLDPQGEAFNYTDQDWRRLVSSFGETGTLIHPRNEKGAARRASLVTGFAEPVPVKSDVMATKTVADSTLDHSADEKSGQEGDSEPLSGHDLSEPEKSDLGARLDDLLGRNKS